VEFRPRPLSRGRIALVAALAALFALLWCTGASAAGTTGTSAFPALQNIPKSQTEPPAGYKLTPLQAIALAERNPVIRAERKKHPGLDAEAYTSSPGHWQVSYFERGKELAQASVDDRARLVTEAWTGHQVAWRMARGYPGAFGRSFNSIWVWLPLGLLFLAPFIDPRRPFRLLHLDLLMLVGFVVSHLFFEQGKIGVSVPLVYPVLAYLFVRMAIVGFRGRRGPPSGRLVPFIPIWVLGFAIIALVGFRVALNMIDSNVVDVGYSGVIGANHIVHGQPLYEGNFPTDNEHGDTYGPVNYLVYIPFERIWPWSGSWDDLPAAHAAAIAFDLLTLLGLFMLGRRLRAGPRGRELGIVLAYAWAAYPYSLFTMASNSNDSLVAMFAVWALVAIASPVGRGVLTGLAAAAKFVSLALIPLFARGLGAVRSRGTELAALCAAIAFVVPFLPFVPDGGIHEIWHRTLGYQVNRPSPFSIWGQVGGLHPLHLIVDVGAAALALLVAFRPQRRDTVTVAALGAAVLLAFQIAAGHWFYLYIVWFAPFVFVALMAPYFLDREAEPTAVETEADRQLEPALP
jgi:hypothetical protein